MFARAGIFLLLLIGGASAAIVNRQPFFFYDTIVYVQGVDAAVGRLLGDRFRTSWTRKTEASGTESSKADSTNRRVGSNIEAAGTIILSGRSIYYGFLLYLSHFLSHFWLMVFIHSVVFIYLGYTLICTCLEFAFRTFVWITAATLILSPASFYISFLMPDILASYVIVAVVILTLFWQSLAVHQRVIVSSILLFCILSHITHLVLLFGLISAIITLQLLFRRSRLSPVAMRTPLIILIAIVLGGFIGELAYYQGVRLTTGAGPIRPPFLMARLIEDGPGYRFLQENCERRTYRVCNFVDRMPITSEDFLWLNDPTRGVFLPADRTAKQELSAEQTLFALDVLYFDPAGQIFVSAKNTIREFLAVGLDEFFASHARLQFYQDGLPPEYLEKLIHGRIASSDKFLDTSEKVFFGVYIISMCGLLLLWWRLRHGSNLHDDQYQRIRMLIMLVLVGLVLNACICGVFAGIFERYQTRVSWLAIFTLLIAMKYSLESRTTPMELSLASKRCTAAIF
jgi:hypothetical protein